MFDSIWDCTQYGYKCCARKSYFGWKQCVCDCSFQTLLLDASRLWKYKVRYAVIKYIDANPEFCENTDKTICDFVSQNLRFTWKCRSFYDMNVVCNADVFFWQSYSSTSSFFCYYEFILQNISKTVKYFMSMHCCWTERNAACKYWIFLSVYLRMRCKLFTLQLTSDYARRSICV